MNDSRYAQRIVLALLLGLAPAVVPSLRGAPVGIQLTTTEKQQLQREARLVVDLLQNHHYSGRAFREIENTEMVTRFLEELDPGADFLTTSDTEHIHRRFDRTLKSVYLFRGDLQPAFEIFDLFAERARKRLDWVARRLTQDFDLRAEETYYAPRKPKTSASGGPADQRWEQRLKDSVVREIVSGRTTDEAQQEVARHYRELGRRIATVDSYAIRERFFDAVIRSFDPHSGYFSADSAREFAIDMENAVTGIGLDLRKEEGRCVVSAVQPGGPADLLSTITPGDTIVALAEGEGPWIEAATTRLSEIVAIVRGREGSRLRLAYLAEGTTDRSEVTLERSRVVLAAERAAGGISMVPDPDGQMRRIGWISLPDFYSGGEGTNVTSAARDIGELLEQMRTPGIDGLVIDLRGNPGGTLTEAVAICQLFLPGGLMMFSRGLDGKLVEHKLKEAPPAYSGPLVVLTSAQSASASEIFAGAMKYHRRGVVVGGDSTYGKGTAQAYMPLAKLRGVDARTAKDWGTLRLTAERFYLPDGRAVQRTGIPSHIKLPDLDPPGCQREQDLPRALPEESITPPPALPPPQPGNLASISDDLLSTLTSQAEQDCMALAEWELWRTEYRYSRDLSEQESRSLQLENRQKRWEELLTRYQAMQSRRRELTAKTSYTTQPLEIAAVQAAKAAREAKLRTLGQPVLHCLRRGGFFIETDHGHLREIRLTDLTPTAYYGDTEALATAFSGAIDRPFQAAQVRRILEKLAQRECRTEAAFLAAVGHIAGNSIDAAAVRTGTEALLRKLSELDVEMRRERTGFDVPLREGQRLAATWAAWLAKRNSP